MQLILKIRLPVMTTNSAPNRVPIPPRTRLAATIGAGHRFRGWQKWCSLMVLLVVPLAVTALPIPGPWTPLFKGIDQAVGTNNPSIAGNFANELQVVHCVRVDLTDPDVQLLPTPRASSWVAESRETLTLSVPHFLQYNSLQIAADSNFYSASSGGADPTSEEISCEVYGVQVSAGTVVSPSASEAGDPRYATFLFTTNKQPTIAFKNLPPGASTAGIYTAITGYYPIVSNGVNIGAAAATGYPDSSIHQTQPRTAYGISQDSRYLYIMTIDGRQGPMNNAGNYSDGALDNETAYWMMQFGAWNAINMDGGGSTAMYMADSIGNPVAINHSSYLAGYGRERYIGSHLGVRAKPLPGFFTNIVVLADDTAATITWTTVDPATTLLQYGVTTNFTLNSVTNLNLTTTHAVLLTNLTPFTSYYYALVGTIGTNRYVSSNFVFSTTNYVVTNAILAFTNSWDYMTANLDGVPWTARTYNEAALAGAGPGLLWADSNGYSESLPQPMLTQLPLDFNGADPNYGFPFITYYFRTHFNFTNSVTGVTLALEDYVDDGAVFYLNGTEVNRVRMPAGAVYNATLASANPCLPGGNATCPDDWTISGPLVTTNLAVGDNVVAVEVHNASTASHDVTFGLSLTAAVPYAFPPTLSFAATNNALTLSWNRGGFTLQQANSPTGTWATVSGVSFVSPYVTTNSGTARFFRLHK